MSVDAIAHPTQRRTKMTSRSEAKTKRRKVFVNEYNTKEGA